MEENNKYFDLSIPYIEFDSFDEMAKRENYKEEGYYICKDKKSGLYHFVEVQPYSDFTDVRPASAYLLKRIEEENFSVLMEKEKTDISAKIEECKEILSEKFEKCLSDIKKRISDCEDLLTTNNTNNNIIGGYISETVLLEMMKVLNLGEKFNK